MAGKRFFRSVGIAPCSTFRGVKDAAPYYAWSKLRPLRHTLKATSAEPAWQLIAVILVHTRQNDAQNFVHFVNLIPSKDIVYLSHRN